MPFRHTDFQREDRPAWAVSGVRGRRPVSLPPASALKAAASGGRRVFGFLNSQPGGTLVRSMSSAHVPVRRGGSATARGGRLDDIGSTPAEAPARGPTFKRQAPPSFAGSGNP